MKRVLIFILSIVLLISLSACGNQPSSPSTAEVEVETNQQEAKEVPDTTPEKKPEFEPVTVIDTDECKVTITGIDPDNYWGYTVKVQLENKSASTSYHFTAEDAFINGVSSYPFWGTEVLPEKKANSDIVFMSTDSLKEKGITEVTDIEIDFRILDSNGMTDVVNEKVHIYPLGKDNATAFERESQASDIVLLDTDEATITLTGFEPEHDMGFVLNLFLANKADHSIHISSTDVSINGFMADPYWGTELASGKSEFGMLILYNEILAENGIDNIEEIEMKFRVSNAEDWNEDAYISDIITLNP